MTIRRHAAGVCLLLCITLGACVNLSKTYVEKKSFVLQVTSEARGVGADTGVVLKIGKFRISPLFAGRAMVYRVSELQYENDFYDEWFVPPGALLTEQFHDWLSASGRFHYVLVGSNHVEPTHLLDGSVVEFYGDYRIGGSPKAVFGIELHLLDGLHDRGIVFRRIYRKEVPMPAASPEALADGLTQAVRQVLMDFDRDLAGVDLTASSSSSR
ncbi:hypothetical protein W02_16950 [Nitrospira sp. KM1]|uniref:ABC-type transport auxiliary lipoprotein family protein n=1 Tax=Nitrospira sp. KM1 TaxID=1936990 RepID=UPI0013A74AD2|nr:ABC-type transport auxiliary lipoprotein family protein [Nitrospira sp. KM1]BCA54555.1 hypothetical protein W02_16950 [Nitrospira sp. KM1]